MQGTRASQNARKRNKTSKLKLRNRSRCFVQKLSKKENPWSTPRPAESTRGHPRAAQEVQGAPREDPGTPQEDPRAPQDHVHSNALGQEIPGREGKTKERQRKGKTKRKLEDLGVLVSFVLALVPRTRSSLCSPDQTQGQPRRSKEHPKRTQGHPKRTQELPKSPKRTKGHPKRTQGHPGMS